MSELKLGFPAPTVKPLLPTLVYQPVGNGNGSTTAKRFKPRRRPKTETALLLRDLLQGKRQSISVIATRAGMSPGFLYAVLRLDAGEAFALAIRRRGLGNKPPASPTREEKLATLCREFGGKDAVLDALCLL